MDTLVMLTLVQSESRHKHSIGMNFIYCHVITPSRLVYSVQHLLDKGINIKDKGLMQNKASLKIHFKL